jgi:hypothetical protein
MLVLAFPASAKSSRNTPAQTAQHSPAANDTQLSLADFGAAGDGVTDDGPAFQGALDALAAAGGGTLFVPAGSYLVATAVVKDFSDVANATVRIQGVPSLTMPAPPTASAEELAAGLDLTSQIIPATGPTQSAFTLTHLHELTVEHIDFTGRPEETTDAFVTLYLGYIEKALIRHCEFYGLSSFGVVPGFGGGNIVRAVQSELWIDVSVFLGCTANSGSYAPVVENIDWRKFTMTNSIFLDYGLRAFFSKTGLGAPFSWINIADAAAAVPESTRREFVVRDTFLDEGGWIGITATPHRWGPQVAPIDLVYISGLKMNVSNLGTAGHAFFDVQNVLIENSHYGWSHNTIAAISLNGIGTAIFDNLTCIDDADRLYADNRTGRLTVINSEFSDLDSQAEITTVFDTAPEQDPVQYVRRQFISTLGQQPDPAAHFYWADRLIKCGQNNVCLNENRGELSKYLSTHPHPEFSIAGTVVDENGIPVTDVAVRLTGSQSNSALTDAEGSFRFSSLPTSGSYTVTVSKRHYSFTPDNQTFVTPADNVTVNFRARLNRHSIGGRITMTNGTGISGVKVQLAQSPTTSVTTDSNGSYSFRDLPAGQNYTVLPSSNDRVFTPSSITFDDLSKDEVANFGGKLQPELLTLDDSEVAIALDSFSFVAQPLSIFSFFGLNGDTLTRVTVFAKNLEPFITSSEISAVAEDDNAQIHPLEIEHIGEVPGHSWLKQLNIKLSRDLPAAGCVKLRISVAGVNSNDAQLCIGRAIR